MKIVLNERVVEINEGTTVIEFLKNLNYKNKVAVFINGKQLLKSELTHYLIQENDSLRIIRVLGGG